jgi:predicted metal-dependent HD superfamily phosphohydrolase
VLHYLSGRDELFHTSYARAHWEPAARANLDRELTRLT